MKKFKLGLFHKVVIGILAGALLGMFLPHLGVFGEVTVRIFETFNKLFAQFLKFIVPLLVLGLVTPSIANLGKGAGKMLLAVIGIAYLSTICSGLFAYGSASAFFPHVLEKGSLTVEGMKTFEPYVDIKIPPLCDIMTALVLSFMTGLGIVFTGSQTVKKFFDEFGDIVKITIESAIIPILPIYIATMICKMGAAGQLAVVFGAGWKIILTGVTLSILYLIIQYSLACAVARKNPFKCLYNMLPAYLTGFSICSSAPCIPVTLDCTLKNGVDKEIGGFVIPLCSTVHMCGSTIKLATTAVAVMYITGTPIPWAMFIHFVLMQGIAAVAAPGVMSGVLMASIGLLESILGFTPEQTTLTMAIYLALDGYGPACNVTGDGAIALVIDRLFRRSPKAPVQA